MTHQMLTLKSLTVPSLSVQTLVVGSGAAGLNAAAALYKDGQHDVALLTEGRTMGTSRNTGSDKQTYYKLTACGSDPDSVRQMADILFSGQAVDGDTALTEAALSSRCFYHLVDLGVPFPCNGNGECVGYKTDHDPNQRGTSAGPLTSKFMTEALWREVDSFHIPVLDGYQLIELLTDTDEVGKRVCGAVALDRKKLRAIRRMPIWSFWLRISSTPPAVRLVCMKPLSTQPVRLAVPAWHSEQERPEKI